MDGIKNIQIWDGMCFEYVCLNVCVCVCMGKDAVAVCAPCDFCEYSFVHLHEGVSETRTYTHIC